MDQENVESFDSFSIVYKVLIWAGYYKLLHKPKHRIASICHQMYRPLAFIIVLIYNLQHIIFIVQRRDNIKDVFDCLVIEIPHFNLIVKILTVNLQISRIEKINKLIKDPIFAPNSNEDKAILLKNKKDMHLLSKFIFGSLSVITLFWPASHFVRRYTDKNAVIPSYMPFETDSWGKYALSIVCEVSPVLWTGFGHIALDCVISIYYSQAEAQLKIINRNLVHLFDSDVVVEGLQYKDEVDPHLKLRFVYYVKRFEKLAWYTKEIGEVFNPAMSFQFITSSISICMVVNRMSSTPVSSIPFAFLIGLILIYCTQVFMYCYFGNMVQYESQLVVESLYLSDWLSVSPKFRRLLLISMLRWSRILTPTVSGIIPLSLNTFVSILRSAYSLYAVLGTRHS